MAGLWQGTPVRIAVFQQRWSGGRMVEHFIMRRKCHLEPTTMADLFEEYPPQLGFTFTVTPRRDGDEHDG